MEAVKWSRTRYGDRYRWDLKRIIEYLAERLQGLSAIYLFGSRAYGTGSRRSDIDLLLYSKDRLVSQGIANAITKEIPIIDIFRTIDMTHAESIANDSQIHTTKRTSLIDELDAILLWSEEGGINEKYEDWWPESRVDVKFVPSVAELPATRLDKIFVGHGHSSDWRLLGDWLKNDLQLSYVEYNYVPAAGIATKERLVEMLADARFALLVATGEVEQADGSMHARENVIHEIGLFQGRLGFEKAIVVLESTCAEFSNIVGLGQVRYPKGMITDAFSEIRSVLQREQIID